MNIIEIANKYPTELSAIEYFESVRWGKQVTCPYCKSKEIFNRSKDYRWHCKKCKK
jgi:ribosomal protein L37AE/L43A